MELILEETIDRKPSRKKKVDHDNLPWIEKYRPNSLNDIISHTSVISTFKKFIKMKTFNHMLLYGPPGTGKTSTIIACAKELYGEYYPFMTMELNASDERGIEVVRTRIKDFVISDNVFFGKNPEERKNIFKMVILDETDALTQDAQAILRKVVEEYISNARFCLICNDIRKITDALKSRCTVFRFPPLNKEQMVKRTIDIAKKEDLTYSKKGIELTIQKSHGDMRKVLNTLQAVNLTYQEITATSVINCLSLPKKTELEGLLTSAIEDSFSEAYAKIKESQDKMGLSLGDIIDEVTDIIVDNILEKNKIKCLKKINLKEKASFINQLRFIQYNLTTLSSEKIQLGTFIGIFKLK